MSFQTIHRHVRRDWRAGGGLYLELRRRYRRGKRQYGLERRDRLPGKRMIDERPAAVESRLEPGHWEIDTVRDAAGNEHCIATRVERRRMRKGDSMAHVTRRRCHQIAPPASHEKGRHFCRPTFTFYRNVA